jgi:RNA 2',3'-cyclic 3'-phosphodiesterase
VTQPERPRYRYVPPGAGRRVDPAPNQRRLFIAVPIPADVVASIADLVEGVRAQGVPGGGRDVRWVRLDGLHVTLRFIGPTPESLVGAATDATRTAAAEHGPFDVGIGGAGAFPTPSRPRALWLDILTGAEELTALAVSVNEGLHAHGWEIDDRPMRPHLTLARSDGIRAGATIASRLIAAAEDLELRFRADRVALFESRTGHGPAEYEPLEVATLGDPSGSGDDAVRGGTGTPAIEHDPA